MKNNTCPENLQINYHCYWEVFEKSHWFHLESQRKWWRQRKHTTKSSRKGDKAMNEQLTQTVKLTSLTFPVIFTDFSLFSAFPA